MVKKKEEENKDKYRDNPNTKEEQEIVDEVMAQYQASYQSKDQLGLHKDWRIFEDYCRNIQNTTNDDDNPGSVTNIIFPVVDSQVSDLVQQPLDVLVKSQTPSEEPFKTEARKFLKWVFYKNKMKHKLERFERARLKFGTGVWKVYYDPDARDKKGMIWLEPVNVANFFPDPKVSSSNLLNEGDFVIHALPKPLNYFKKRFGERGKYVKRGKPPVNPQIFKGEMADEVKAVTADKNILIERWSKEENGELRVVHVADGTLLFDSKWSDKKTKKESKEQEASGFYKHKRYPFVVVPCYPREGILWGFGDVELLKPTQDLVNDLDDQIRMNARLMGNVQMVVGVASGINIRKWTNKPGLKIPARDPLQWQTVQPPEIPAYIYNRRSEGKQEAELVSGRVDVVEGRRAPGLRAASAIIALQEAGNRRVNHKKTISEEALQEVCELVLEYFEEFFTEEQSFRVPGDEGAPDDFLTTRGSELGGIPMLAPETREDGTVEWNPLKDKEGKEITKKAEFDVEVHIGAGLPDNKAFLYQSVMELYQANLVTKDEARIFLKQMLDWPLINPQKPTGEFEPRGGTDPNEIMSMIQQMQGGGMQQGGGMPGGGMQGGGYDAPQGLAAQPGATPQEMGTQLPPELMQNIIALLGGRNR